MITNRVRIFALCAAIFIGGPMALATTGTLEVQVVPFTPTPTSTPLPTSGGSGNSQNNISAAVEFSGTTFPRAYVVLLIDGRETDRVVANSRGEFHFTLSGLTGGSYVFGFFSQDELGYRNEIFSFMAVPILGSTTQISNIILPPLVSIKDTLLPNGAIFLITGRAVPNAKLEASINSDPWQEIGTSGLDGNFQVQISTENIGTGKHTIRLRFSLGEDISPQSQEFDFIVGEAGILAKCKNTPDINDDGRVDLVDFSIMAFWYGRDIPIDARFDLNCDGEMTLADVSILAYFWTG
jgi:hypothetical protein